MKKQSPGPKYSLCEICPAEVRKDRGCDEATHCKMVVISCISARYGSFRTYGVLPQYTISKCEAELKHAWNQSNLSKHYQ